MKGPSKPWQAQLAAVWRARFRTGPKSDVIASVLHVVFKALNPRIHTAVLGAEHVEAAAELLTDEFCRREPLCRLLKIAPAELLPFFRQQVAHVAAEGLGVVALDRRNVVRGAMTVEDHCALFQPDGLAVTESLALIGAYLDQTEVPAALIPEARGVLYYCGLAAVHSLYRRSTLLSLMVLANYAHLRRLGYKHGYAKVTNPRVNAHLFRLERLAGKKDVFKATSTTKPADFVYQGRRPFHAYQGMTWLITWTFP